MRRALWLIALVYAQCSVFAALAIAKAPAEVEVPITAANRSYMFSYTIVVLGIALGLMAVCRSGKRGKDPIVVDDSIAPT